MFSLNTDQHEVSWLFFFTSLPFPEEKLKYKKDEEWG
jgi:hypothetical protein